MKKEKLTHKLAAKITAFVILALCVPLCVAWLAGAYILMGEDFYTKSLDGILTDEFRDISFGETYELAYAAARKETHPEHGQAMLYEMGERLRHSNAAFQVERADGTVVYQTDAYDEKGDAAWQFRTDYAFQKESLDLYLAGENIQEEDLGEAADGVVLYRVHTRVDDAFTEYDTYRITYRVYSLLYKWRYAVFFLVLAAALLALVSFIFLMCSAGRHPGKEMPEHGFLSNIPFDLYTVLTGITCLLLLMFGADIGGVGRMAGFLTGCCAAEIALLLFVVWCMQFAVCIKCGGWMKKTILWRVCHVIAGIFRSAGRLFLTLIRSIPLVPKTVLLLLAVNVTELFLQLLFLRDHDMRLISWFFLHAVTGIAILMVAIQLRRLQKGSEMLAAGNLTYQITTERLLPSLKQSAENLNHIADGMQTAVSQQMKSERMKTELITNVSHDIKTPLTSIINYIGLLKEAHTKEQEEEYIGVLDRQSQRLKKLTEDLVEASKASSGSMDVNREKQSLNELLRQAVGEYQERLDEVPLETVVDIPEQTVYACVDGKLMWRVLDNLLLNACKYAMPHTRCYAELEELDGEAHLRIKNISKERLNISPEELTERFVRGDASRGGEGSGLGLHIAKSLTDLMGGALQVTVDGDLFKAEIVFPAA